LHQDGTSSLLIKTDVKEIKGRGCGLDWSGWEQGPAADRWEHDNNPWGSIKGTELLD